MYLRALEIQGFKSFPDKTVLNFGEDITAIVGPNGSGKSNISDAIRWVMGEQSSKSLRGAKMEDVIFGGTEKRNQMGFAQVTLVLDNTEHIFPHMDEVEVAVTRRYYRSGESEYYINKQSVRLKDVNELFMDTGMGKEGYSIIGQGRIDEILSVKSGERREIFEEAAGISKFRHRKEEAERKLAHTDENLVRINDKIAELELQVEPLREQAEKAKRFLILRDELRSLEISVWLHNLEELRAKKVKIDTDCSIAQQELARVSEALEKLYADAEMFAARVRENDMEQETLRADAARMDAAAGDEDAAIAVLKTNIAHNDESIARAEEELRDQSGRAENLRAQIDEQHTRIDELSAQAEELEAELSELVAQAEEAAKNVGSAADEVESLRAKEALAVAAAADERAAVSALEAQRHEMTERSETVKAELEAARTQLDEKRAEAKKCRRALEEAQDEANAVSNIITGHTMKMEGRQKCDEEANERKVQLTIEQSNLASRIRLLAEMEKEYEGFNKAVRFVMQSSERGALRGVHGPVANLMETDREYAVAIEIALGAAMQNIVVDREEVAKAAITLLKQRDGGRATFLPMSAIRANELREKGVGDEYGFVGIASELVRHDKKYDAIFANLLAATVVVEDMDCGIAIARKYQNRFRIVTLDGQIINRGGSMTGGSVSKNAGILSRANELKELRAREEKLAAQLEDAEREAAEARRELTAAQYELEVAQSQRREAEDAVLRLTGDKNHYDVLLGAIESNCEALEAELETLTARIDNSAKEAAAHEARIREQEALAADFAAQAQSRQSGQSELAALSGKLAEDITERKTALAGLTSEREATTRALSDLERLCADMQGDRESRTRLVEQYRTANEQARAQIEVHEAKSQKWRSESAALREKIAALSEEKLQLEAERGSTDRRVREMNGDILNHQGTVSKLEQKRTQAAMEEKQILDRLWEFYELSYSAATEQATPLESVTKANRRIGELKREIASLGSVNVGAIDEFERVNTRYTYLAEQRDDVSHAKEELVGIIENITREMTKIFAEQFKIINESFSETFVELFGGGKATLELEDENDILNCGIEIKVQPPGKTLKTLMLLSGGEKAFVAIALYFAILKVHPTPFCVMDEIEAALDEANVVRCAKYMRRIAGKTQFIVITHRRGTMEEADVLYGVTMQERGVSHILTINMNDLAKELKIK
ncbi:MAG: chromosome segregation protein SMC [Oscillospiraceae bacterium]|nr:chromosome segregation protein SMC [Oscillospiraceae bacterium]